MLTNDEARDILETSPAPRGGRVAIAVDYSCPPSARSPGRQGLPFQPTLGQGNLHTARANGGLFVWQSRESLSRIFSEDGIEMRVQRECSLQAPLSLDGATKMERNDRGVIL